MPPNTLTVNKYHPSIFSLLVSKQSREDATHKVSIQMYMYD